MAANNITLIIQNRTVPKLSLNPQPSNEWGKIGGLLSNQLDLWTALLGKADAIHSHTFASLTLKPTTLAGYGITDAASLDGSGKVPASQLPSYVDDVLEFANSAAFPITGETGKIYIAIDTNYQYRWTGSTYIQITSSSAVWGSISGNLSTQSDLVAALASKYDASNPAGYITSSALSPYLLATTAASTYQPIGTYATPSNAMTFTNKSGNISQWTNDSGYITSAALSPYLLASTAASTYQPIGSYLTANQTITLSGVVTGSGSTAINTSFASTTGSGAVVLATSPTINTPSINGFATFISTGTPPSGEPNYFVSTILNPTGNQYNIRSTYNVNSAINNSAIRIGGVLGETYIQASNSGQLGWAIGTYGYVQNYGTGTVVRAIGSYNIVANRGNGAITNIYGGYFKTENDTTGNITFNAGVYVDTPSNSGTIVTNAGVYVSPQSGVGSTNYAFYSAGALDLSRLEGSLLVATSLTSSTVTNTPILAGTTLNGITYKATTGNPTLTDAAHLFVGGNNGATEIIRFLNNGNIRIPNARVIQGLDSAGTYRDLFTWSGGDNIIVNGRPGVSDITFNPTSGGLGLVIKSTGDAGIGVATPGARWHIIKTTEQLRTGFDASNYASYTVSSVGGLTISMTGTDPSIRLLNSISHKFSVWGATPITRPAAVTSVQGLYDAMASIGLIASGTISGGGSGLSEAEVRRTSYLSQT